MPGRVSLRRASQRARNNVARQLLQGKSTYGGIARDDSDDELGDDDIPWTWVYPTFASPLSPVTANPRDDQPPDAKRVRREVPILQNRNVNAKPVGAKCGTFECQVGDCLLLKAQGQKIAWVGLAVDFEQREEEKSVLIMW